MCPGSTSGAGTARSETREKALHPAAPSPYHRFLRSEASQTWCRPRERSLAVVLINRLRRTERMLRFSSARTSRRKTEAQNNEPRREGCAQHPKREPELTEGPVPMGTYQTIPLPRAAVSNDSGLETALSGFSLAPSRIGASASQVETQSLILAGAHPALQTVQARLAAIRGELR